MNSSTKEYIIKHKANVQSRMLKLSQLLRIRADLHDNSKLEEPEIIGWRKMDQEPRYPYGSPEYFDKKRRYEYLFNQHYQDPRNTHHPEHFKDQGVSGMDLLDLLEFLCDSFSYKSETLTYTEASAVLDKQIERFNISEDLGWALRNTVQNYFCKFGGLDDLEKPTNLTNPTNPCPYSKNLEVSGNAVDLTV